LQYSNSKYNRTIKNASGTSQQLGRITAYAGTRPIPIVYKIRSF